MPAPAERAMAIAAGRKFYVTGKPCIRGHTAKRRAIDGSCVTCRLILQRVYDAANHVDRRRNRRDQKRAKRQAAEQTDEQTISLVAHEGTHKPDEARAWVDVQAKRLGVTSSFVTDGVRNGWTLLEIEQLPVEDAPHLADHVSTHMPEDGHTPANPFSVWLA